MFPFWPNMHGNPRRHEAQDMHGRTTAASLSLLLFHFPGAFLVPAPALPWDGLPFPGQAFHRAEGLFVLLGTVCCAVPGVCFALPEGQESRGRGRGCQLPCRNTKREKGGPVYSSAQCSLSRQRDFLVFQSKTLKKGQGRGGCELLGCCDAGWVHSPCWLCHHLSAWMDPSDSPVGLPGTKPAVSSTPHGREGKSIHADGLGGSQGHCQGWEGPPTSGAQSPAPHQHLPQAGQALAPPWFPGYSCSCCPWLIKSLA